MLPCWINVCNQETRKQP